MPPKAQRQAPPATIDGRTAGALALLVAIVIAAVVAFSGALGGGPGSGTPSPDSSVLPGSSDVASPSPASAVLEGLIPKQVDATTLTVNSATDASSIANDPTGRALDAAVLSLGKQPGNLEIGVAYDASGSVDLSIIGFRVSGVTAATLVPIILETWVASHVPGVTTTQVTLSGNPVTQVSYGDSGSNEYVFTFKDAVFVVETADSSLATDAVVAITGVSASPGPSIAAPSASPGPSGSAAPSATPSAT